MSHTETKSNLLHILETAWKSKAVRFPTTVPCSKAPWHPKVSAENDEQIAGNGYLITVKLCAGSQMPACKHTETSHVFNTPMSTRSVSCQVWPIGERCMNINIMPWKKGGGVFNIQRTNYETHLTSGQCTWRLRAGHWVRGTDTRSNVSVSPSTATNVHLLDPWSPALAAHSQ